MNDFINSIRLRYGDGAAAVAEVWVRSLMLMDTPEHSPPTKKDIGLVLKENILTVVRITNTSADTFKTIVEESNALIRGADILH